MVIVFVPGHSSLTTPAVQPEGREVKEMIEQKGKSVIIAKDFLVFVPSRTYPHL